MILQGGNLPCTRQHFTDSQFLHRYWLQRTKYTYNGIELVREDVPYRPITISVGEAAKDVEDARAAGRKLQLNKTAISRVTAPDGAERTRSGEQWDLYKLEILSYWPMTLYEPQPDHKSLGLKEL
jgi:hypothetical protein